MGTRQEPEETASLAIENTWEIGILTIVHMKSLLVMSPQFEKNAISQLLDQCRVAGIDTFAIQSPTITPNMPTRPTKTRNIDVEAPEESPLFAQFLRDNNNEPNSQNIIQI